ncbi:MAG: hypothetical protein K6F53_05965 [Lachnospiraceae bacterium]|nr:hypothetical protein [Lachnospiraceae bacterium]
MKQQFIKRLAAMALLAVMFVSYPLESLADEITYDELPFEDESISSDETSDELSEDATNSFESDAVGLSNDDISITGTDSVGQLLGDALSGKASEQIENDGHNIFSVEMNGATASVDFETLHDAELIVAIYEEDGVKLLGTGKTFVLAGETSCEVAVGIDPMPQYFYIRAYLVLDDSLESLCTPYENPNYTREMQEFLATTATDFEQDLILNLDESVEDNFLVYNEDVIRIAEDGVTNTVISVNEETSEYVFGEIDTKIADAVPGNTIAYEYADGSLVIFVIDTIGFSEDGKTATITGKQGELEEIFDFVKIDAEADEEEATVENSERDPEIEYLGELTNEEFDEIAAERTSVSEEWADGTQLNGANIGEEELTFSVESLNAIDGEESFKKKISYYAEHKPTAKTKFKAAFGLSFKGVLKYYVSFSKQYIEFRLDYEIFASVSTEGKLEKKWPIDKIVITPLPGVNIVFTPSFIIGISGKIEAKVKIEGRIGTSYRNGQGWKNLTNNPKIKSEIEAEIKVYCGISFEPEINIISKHVAYAGMEAKILGVVKGTLGKSEPVSATRLHTCRQCIDGTIGVEASCSFKVRFLNLKWLTKEVEYKFEHKIADWYLSLDNMEWGLGKCPHQYYAVRFSVKNSKGKAIPNATVSGLENFMALPLWEGGSLPDEKEYYEAVTSIQADNHGIAKGYQQKIGGNYTVSVTADHYRTGTHWYSIKKDKVTKNNIILGENPEDPPADEDDDQEEFIVLSTKVEQACLGKESSAAVDSDGNLWIWGYTFGLTGDFAYSYTPVKVMTGVKKVSIGWGDFPDYAAHIGVLKADNSLWLWGSNKVGQIGNGSTRYASTPVKVMSNVRDFTLGYKSSYAIKNNGELWFWGREYKGKEWVDSGSYWSVKYTNVTKPQKVLDDVEKISVDEDCFAALKSDGGLWIWGKDVAKASFDSIPVEYNPESDSYDNVDVLTPALVLEEVKNVSIGRDPMGNVSTGAIVWDWYDYDYGQNDYIYGDTIRLSGKLNGTANCVQGGSQEFSVKKPVSDIELAGWQIALLGTDKKLAIVQPENLNREEGTYDFIEKFENDVQSVVLNKAEGARHDAYIGGDGSLWVWGYNECGQIGDGTDRYVAYPKPVMIPSEGTDGSSADVIADEEYDDTASDIVYLFEDKYDIAGASDENENAVGNSDSEVEESLSESAMAARIYETPESVDERFRVSFSELEAYSGYNLYVVEDAEYDPLDSENLLYIHHGTTDGNGDLTFEYVPKADCPNAAAFVVKQWADIEDEIRDGDINSYVEVPNGIWMAGLNDLIYDGTAQTQDIRIYDGKTLLVANRDYTVSYKNNKNAYTYTPEDEEFRAKKAPQLTIKMKGNYSGKKTVYFCIKPLSIEDKSQFSVALKKKGKTSVAEISWKGKKLKKNTDYLSIKWPAYYAIYGEGNFKGTRTIYPTDVIGVSQPVSITKARVASLPNRIYNGIPYTTENVDSILEGKLTYKEYVLVPGTDYQVTKVLNGDRTGWVTLVLQGLNNKKSINPPVVGERRIKIKVLPYNVSKDDITVTDMSDSGSIVAAYTKGGARPAIKVRFNGTTLKQGRDYTVKYKNNTAVSSKKKPLIEIAGKGNFAGKRSVVFAIEQSVFATDQGITVLAADKALPKDATKYQTKILVYDRNGVLLKAGTDYKKSVVYKKDDIVLGKNSRVSAGDVITVEVTGSGKNYTADTISVTYTILENDIDISKATIKIKDQAYTGRAIRITGASQISKATIGKQKTPLQISVDGGKTGDFIAVPGSYVKNVQKGTAKVTFKGINGCGGYKTVSFKIKSRSVLSNLWYGLLDN